MILKGYFDGGNEADSRQYDVVTLASVSGITAQWKPFEREWKATLRKYDACWLHTTDAVSLSGIYRRASGWDTKRRDAFITDCVKVAENHVAVPRRRWGLAPFTITVVLNDFKKAVRDNSEVPKDVTEICAAASLYNCFDWGEHIETDFYYLYFDRGEPFRGHVCDRCRNRKALKEFPSLNRIKHIGESDMRDVPALQLADLFAWCVSHKNHPLYGWQRKLLKLPRMDAWMDYEKLIKPVPRTTELVKKWKLPRRKPTR